MTYESIAPKFAEISQGIEESARKGFEQTVLNDVQKEFKGYFDHVRMHPRLLIGQTVHDLRTEDGTITIRDSADAKDWQEAVKSLLTQEIQGRVSKLSDEYAPSLRMAHAAVELFQKNHDLVPGTNGFDKELATSFTQMMKPYEIREDGKLQGYSIDVQPIIDNLRGQLQQRRAAPPATPAAPAPKAPPAPVHQPQVGIPSQAGNSAGQAEDYSALWGTLGIRI